MKDSRTYVGAPNWCPLLDAPGAKDTACVDGTTVCPALYAVSSDGSVKFRCLALYVINSSNKYCAENGLTIRKKGAKL